MTKHWPVVEISVPSSVTVDEWDYFVSRIMDAGCLGLQEPPASASGVPASATLYFPAHSPESPQWDKVVASVAEEAFPTTAAKITPGSLPDQDWGAAWREYFHITRTGNRVYVGPPWEKELPADAPADAVHIMIEPGQAFGTGTHETTRLCLGMVDRLAGKHRGELILDIGTGSGVLLFLALKLGLGMGLGMENDSVCEENFELNAGLNGVADRAHFLHGDSLAAPRAWLAAHKAPRLGLVACNMLSEQFDPLLEDLRTLDAVVLLSGFLNSEADRVRARLAACRFRVGESFTQGEWGGFECVPA